VDSDEYYFHLFDLKITTHNVGATTSGAPIILTGTGILLAPPDVCTFSISNN
jgi:hypothetical protein